MTRSNNAQKKIEASLFEIQDNECTEVFIHVAPGAIDLLTTHLHSLGPEVTAEPYTQLGLILTRVSLQDMEKLAERNDVIKISSQGEIILE